MLWNCLSGYYRKEFMDEKAEHKGIKAGLVINEVSFFKADQFLILE